MGINQAANQIENVNKALEPQKLITYQYKFHVGSFVMPFFHIQK